MIVVLQQKFRVMCCPSEKGLKLSARFECWVHLCDIMYTNVTLMQDLVKNRVPVVAAN